MAMFENMGYCPANAIERLNQPELMKELGVRHLWMVYLEETTYNEPLILTALTDKVMGPKLVKALAQEVTPCTYPTTSDDERPKGKAILLSDAWSEGELVRAARRARRVLYYGNYIVAIGDGGKVNGYRSITVTIRRTAQEA